MNEEIDSQNLLDSLKGDMKSLLRTGKIFSIEKFYEVLDNKSLIKWLNRRYQLNKPDLEKYDEVICKELQKRLEFWDFIDIPDSAFKYILDLTDCFR